LSRRGLRLDNRDAGPHRRRDEKPRFGKAWFIGKC
jgi:hypothetical protein